VNGETCPQCRRNMIEQGLGDVCEGCGSTPDSCDCKPLVTGDIAELLPGAKCPDGYEVDAGGVHALRTAKDGSPIRTRAAWAPLIPVRVFVDPAGDQLVELAWFDRGRWVRRIVARSVAKSGRRLVAQLGDAGLPVTDADAKLAERWLAAFEQVNRGVVTSEKIARQLGWQRDGQFIACDGSPYKVEPKYDEQRGALESHHPRGTLAGWRNAVRVLGDYPAALPSLYAGFAAALLHPLGLDSFTVDTSGRSTRGKTISAMCGASCWHDPSEKSDGMFHWRTTMIAIEKRFNLCNGLPVVVDETRTVKTPELVDQVLYQVPKNRGTPRGGGWPSMLPWRVIVLSTGEQPALSFTSHEGASARVLSVRRAPFGSDGEQSAAAAGRARDGVTANYGTAGPEFVRRLRAALADDGQGDGGSSIAARHRELTEKFRGQSDIAARRAPLVACLHLAGQLAHEWGIIPFPPPGVDEWLGLFAEGDQARNDNRPEMALDVVREFLFSHQDKMLGTGDGEHPPASGWIGTKATEGPALVPEKLREELKRRGYELDAVIPGWLEMGALVTRDSQRPKYMIPRRLGGRLVKLLIFRSEVIDPEGDDDQ
jgi:hypothetical protein